jgi:hypothetical protein
MAWMSEVDMRSGQSILDMILASTKYMRHPSFVQGQDLINLLPYLLQVEGRTMRE